MRNINSEYRLNCQIRSENIEILGGTGSSKVANFANRPTAITTEFFTALVVMN